MSPYQIIGLSVLMGWVGWLLEKGERKSARQVSEYVEDTERLQAFTDRVAAKRRRPEWERRLSAYWRRGNQILDRSK